MDLNIWCRNPVTLVVSTFDLIAGQGSEIGGAYDQWRRRYYTDSNFYFCAFRVQDGETGISGEVVGLNSMEAHYCEFCLGTPKALRLEYSIDLPHDPGNNVQ